MPQPTANQVHTDAILTQISVAYMQAQENFIATRVFPSIPVQKQSDLYYVFTKGDWFRDEAKLRGDCEESAGSGYNLSTDSYQASVYAMHKDVGALAKANTDNPLDWRRNATQFVMQRLMLRRELDWQSSFFTTGVWDTDVTPTNTWDDYASSDPITDIETGKETILSATGFEPNKLVLGYETFRQLKHHPDIVDRYKYTTADSITEEMMARVFGIDEVLVAKSIQNTTKEGAADSFSFVHGKNALLVYSASTPSVEVPSAGYTFEWVGVSGGLGQPAAMSELDMPAKKCTRVEGEIAFDHKVVASDLGYFFSGAVA